MLQLGARYLLVVHDRLGHSYLFACLFSFLFFCSSLLCSVCLPLPLLLCALSFKRIKLSLDFCCSRPSASRLSCLSCRFLAVQEQCLPCLNADMSDFLVEHPRLDFQNRLAIKRCSRLKCRKWSQSPVTSQQSAVVSRQSLPQAQQLLRLELPAGSCYMVNGKW